MGVLRYDQAPAGTFDPAKILLQADATTGDLEKILFSSFVHWLAVTGGINFPGGNVGINNAAPDYLLELIGVCDTNGKGPLKVKSDGSNNIGVSLTLDAEAATSGQQYSFLSTGSAASDGGGCFSILNNTIPAYVFSIDKNAMAIIGINQYVRNAMLSIFTKDATTLALLLRVSNGHSGNALEIRDVADNIKMLIDAEGRMSIRTSLQAFLTIGASSGAAGQAPILIEAGTLLTTPANGTIEYDGTNFYITTGGVRTSLASIVPPAGSNGQIQYNNSGAFGASSAFSWDTTFMKLLFGNAGSNKASVYSFDNSGAGIAFEVDNGAFTMILQPDGNLTIPGDLTIPGNLILASGSSITFTETALSIWERASTMSGVRQRFRTAGVDDFLNGLRAGQYFYFDGQSSAQGFWFGNNCIGAPEDQSAMLQIDSTTKGFLPPRMTTTEKNAITSPAEGLTVYDLTTHTLSTFNGTVWL